MCLSGYVLGPISTPMSLEGPPPPSPPPALRERWILTRSLNRPPLQFICPLGPNRLSPDHRLRSAANRAVPSGRIQIWYRAINPRGRQRPHTPPSTRSVSNTNVEFT
jgi:hypothetical protein